MKIVNVKRVYDIFSKKKHFSKNAKERKLIVDYREKNSLVPSELLNLGFVLEFKELKIADYIVKDVAIERKTVDDFVSSMINKRLFRQLEELQSYKKRLLIIEGIEERELYAENSGVNQKAIKGFLLSIVLNYKVPIIFSKNAEDTASFIEILEKKEKKDFSWRAKKKIFTKKEQMEFILEGFPNIGVKKAKLLLKEKGSLENIFNSSLDDLKKILGARAEPFKKLVEEKYK